MLSATVLADPAPPAAAGTAATERAAPRPVASDVATGDCAIARRLGTTCVLDVPAEDVAGHTAAAGDVGVQVLGLGEAPSLIRLRRDFVFEIVKTAEDL